MSAENDLIKKLMISKQIMNKHNEMPRGQAGPGNINIPQTPELQDFNVPQANYNIPNEFLGETQIPKTTTSTNGIPTKDRILSSKLPDEIKKLMIEHPINQPNTMKGPSLSDDLVEKASRLMNVNAAGQQTKKQNTQQPQQQFSGLDADTIKSIVRETVEEVLSENGLLVESTSKSNELFSFKVGKHIFEGKVTKIKKIQS